MIRLRRNYLPLKVMLLATILKFSIGFAQSGPINDTLSHSIESAEQINPTTFELVFSDKQRLTIDFYGENIFRVFEDNFGGIIRNPEASPPASILVDNPRKLISGLTLTENAHNIIISSAKEK